MPKQKLLGSDFLVCCCCCLPKTGREHKTLFSAQAMNISCWRRGTGKAHRHRRRQCNQSPPSAATFIFRQYTQAQAQAGRYTVPGQTESSHRFQTLLWHPRPFTNSRSSGSISSSFAPLVAFDLAPLSLSLVILATFPSLPSTSAQISIRPRAKQSPLLIYRRSFHTYVFTTIKVRPMCFISHCPSARETAAMTEPNKP